MDALFCTPTHKSLSRFSLESTTPTSPSNVDAVDSNLADLNEIAEGGLVKVGEPMAIMHAITSA